MFLKILNYSHFKCLFHRFSTNLYFLINVLFFCFFYKEKYFLLNIIKIFRC